ncbi:hypothetical protein ABUL04_02185 [Micromonospora harpali]|uniref:Uncharacterized protein n=1 Tax=Micromonospora harpali TaxID=1490225 RepID=A0ABW1HJH9_9ACTN
MIKKLIDIDLPNKGTFPSLLERFDHLCHLRHAAVHAHGSIGTANAAALGVAKVGARLSLDINLPRVHESAMICRSVVQELNQFLFIKTFYRWRDGGLLARDYSLDRERFTKLYNLFRSMRDPSSKNMQPKMAYAALLK